MTKLTDEEKLSLCIAAGMEVELSGWRREGDKIVGELRTVHPCSIIETTPGKFTVVVRKKP